VKGCAKRVFKIASIAGGFGRAANSGFDSCVAGHWEDLLVSVRPGLPILSGGFVAFRLGRIRQFAAWTDKIEILLDLSF
jgi:hypothetical protein